MVTVQYIYIRLICPFGTKNSKNEISKRPCQRQIVSHVKPKRPKRFPSAAATLLIMSNIALTCGHQPTRELACRYNLTQSQPLTFQTFSKSFDSFEWYTLTIVWRCSKCPGKLSQKKHWLELEHVVVTIQCGRAAHLSFQWWVIVCSAQRKIAQAHFPTANCGKNRKLQYVEIMKRLRFSQWTSNSYNFYTYEGLS